MYYAGGPADGIADAWVRTISYTYDAAGNRTSRTVDTNAGTESDIYHINAESGYELDSISGANPASFEYDDGGRMTSLTRDGDPRGLTYDSAGQLTGVNGVGGSDVDYVYQSDALGNRTAATTDGTVDRNFLVAPAAQRLGAGALDVTVQHLAADGAGNLLTGWVYAGENPILRFDEAGNPALNSCSRGYEGLG